MKIWLLLIIILLIGVWLINNKSIEKFTCIRTGCNGNICSDRPVMTPCDWKCEYGCYKNADCVNINGKCQFIKTGKFNDCLKLCKDNTLLSQIPI